MGNAGTPRTTNGVRASFRHNFVHTRIVGFARFVDYGNGVITTGRGNLIEDRNGRCVVGSNSVILFHFGMWVEEVLYFFVANLVVVV